jgi:hypothetical protein
VNRITVETKQNPIDPSQEWDEHSTFHIPHPKNFAIMYEETERDTKPNVDIETVIPTGNDIQLDAFKCLPDFSGIPGTYRNWKNQVWRAIKPIEKFTEHPKYGAALCIIRAKIVGPASNTLINSGTAYNFHAFLTILDRAYTDLRPIYAIEAELTSIVQATKTLRDFHAAINEALNTLITKIIQTYSKENAVKAMMTEAQQKAVRTFILGLRSSYIRQILYGRTPETLDQALAIALTVYYDSDHLRLEKTNQYSQGNNFGGNDNQRRGYRNNNNTQLRSPSNNNQYFRTQNSGSYQQQNNNQHFRKQNSSISNQQNNINLSRQQPQRLHQLDDEEETNSAFLDV